MKLHALHKMAAPRLRPCFANMQRGVSLIRFKRFYARYVKRSIQTVYNPEEDVHRSKNSHTVIDPKQNPFAPFVPGDPVQKGLIEVARKHIQSKKVVANSNVSKQKSNIDTNDEKPKDVIPDKPSVTVNKDIKISAHIKKEVVGTDRSKKLKNPTIASTRKEREIQNNNISQQLHKGKNKVSCAKSEITFEKLDENDRRFGKAIIQARSKKEREEHREIVLEGKKCIIDALAAGAKMKALYFSGADLMEDFPVDVLKETPIFKVQHKLFKIWSQIDNTQGLLAIFEMPPVGVALQPPSISLPVTVIFDQVTDPGNIGTLIRTAAAIGCQKVIATKGCIDVWNEKVLRAAAGSHFCIPVFNNMKWSQVPQLLPCEGNMNVFVTNFFHMTNQLRENLAGKPWALERIAAWREKELERSVNQVVFDKSLISVDETNDDKDDSSLESSSNVDIEEDESYNNTDVLQLYAEAPVNVRMYDSIDYTEKHMVLVINGETSAMSLPARKLVYDNFGECVTIPTAGELASLNCAIGGSIVLYEVAKQYRKLEKHKQSMDSSAD